MVIPLKEKLEYLADNILLGIDHFLLDQKIIESILETYRKSCRSLNIKEKPITDEMRLRLRFEFLCFSTFYTSLQSSKYFTEKTWSFINSRPDQGIIQLFDGAIGASLIKLCNNTGLSELHEITFYTIADPKTLDLSDHVDPLDRLEEYRSAFIKERGSEIERFGKWIGKSLDAQHYPLLEAIGDIYGLELIKSNMISKIYNNLTSSQEFAKIRDDMNNFGEGNVVIIKCNNCSQKIRAPLGKKLRVTCPNCGNIFEMST